MEFGGRFILSPEGAQSQPVAKSARMPSGMAPYNWLSQCRWNPWPDHSLANASGEHQEVSMTYVDGFVLAVPKQNIDAYKKNGPYRW